MPNDDDNTIPSYIYAFLPSFLYPVVNARLDVINDFCHWSQFGWFPKTFQEWRSHAWKLLTNHLTNDQMSLLQHRTLLMTSYIIFYIWCAFTRFKTRGNRRKTSSILPFADVICGGTFDYDIVTSHKTIMWRYFERLSSERFMRLHNRLRLFSFSRQVDNRIKFTALSSADVYE